MSDNILVDGKPLNSLRVVDLKEELRKRGIKSSGTKSQLQQLLLTALNSTNNQVLENVETIENEEIKDNNEIPEKINDATTTTTTTINNDNNNNDDSKDENSTEKVASISINEEKETIKLTIRSSPRKQEPFLQQDSESEESQSDDNDSDNDRKIKNESIIMNESELSTNFEQSDDKMEDESDNKRDDESIKDDNVNRNESIDQSDECEKENQINEKIEENKKEEECIEERREIKSDDSSKSRTLTLKNRIMSQKSTEESTHKPIQKKRRWGSSHTNESSVLTKGISSDELKQLINNSMIENDQPPNSKVSKSNEDKTFFSNNKMDESSTQQKSKNEMNDTEIKKVDISFKNDSESSQTNTTINNNQSKQEETDNQRRSVSPAKNPESTVLFITGLVRPYTLMQLKKLLNNVGQIDEEKFWIDKIKSKCYATYSSIEEAVETRKKLHNLKWPQSSPKNLCVEFATLEDIDRCLNPENYEDLPMKNIEKNSLSIDESKGKYDIIMKEPKIEMFNNKNRLNDKSDIITDVAASRSNIREWDRDKIPIKNSRNEDKEKNNDNHRQLKKQESDSPRHHHHHQQQQQHPLRDKSTKTTEKIDKKEERSNQHQQQEQQRSESPMNSLEDLFRKTKTIPYIYWLPLTEEQALEREKYRIKLEKEREARISQRYEMSSRRSPALIPPSRDMHRGRRNSPINFRRKPSSYSPVHRRNQSSRYSRSRSPDRRRFSPRRR